MMGWWDGNLVVFVEEEAEVGEGNPQLLPAVAVLELAQQVTTQLVLWLSRVVVKGGC